MRFLITYIGILAFFIVFTEASNAQVGFAIAIDENRSGLHWQWVKAEKRYLAGIKAKEMLRSKGYEKVTTQPCDKCGHNLGSGYWVVVYSNYKIYDGSTKTGYGLGISTESHSEAERRAIRNLWQYNSWSKSKDGYEIDESGRF